jgi:hypothetical protein
LPNADLADRTLKISTSLLKTYARNSAKRSVEKVGAVGVGNIWSLATAVCAPEPASFIRSPDAGAGHKLRRCEQPQMKWRQAVASYPAINEERTGQRGVVE